MHQPGANVHYVFYVDEITDLLSVFIIRVVGAKEFYAALVADLVICVEYHRSHAALVVFVRSVDVEEFQAGPERRCFLLLQRPDVKLVFRDAIRIERMQFRNYIVVVFIAMLAIAICGC